MESTVHLGDTKTSDNYCLFPFITKSREHIYRRIIKIGMKDNLTRPKIR